MVACGTAYYACLTAKYWFEQIARLPVEVDVASEFRYREPPVTGRHHGAFRQPVGRNRRHAGGPALRRDKADTVLSVVNVPESSIARESDVALPILAGAEIGVASTKAFTNQLTVLALLALKAARDRGQIDARAAGAAPGGPAHSARPAEPRTWPVRRHRQHRRQTGRGAGRAVSGPRPDVSSGP